MQLLDGLDRMTQSKLAKALGSRALKRQWCGYVNGKNREYGIGWLGIMKNVLLQNSRLPGHWLFVKFEKDTHPTGLYSLRLGHCVILAGSQSHRTVKKILGKFQFYIFNIYNK